jgi:hypothetical protein
MAVDENTTGIVPFQSNTTHETPPATQNRYNEYC